MHGRVDADEMPRLDAFDEEFGREPVAILRGQRRKTKLRLWAVVVLVLAAGIVGAFAFAWPNVDLLAQLQSISLSSTKAVGREGADEQVDRLRREVAALKKDVRDLTEAQQQATNTIAALRAAEQEHRTTYWYSEPAGLMFGLAREQPRPVAAAPSPRPVAAAPPLRPAAAVAPRPKPQRKRDAVTPLSIEADTQQ
jgi:hypothetical protein